MMPESRDRLARPVDVAALFVHRRSAGVWIDQPALEFPTPARLGAPATEILRSRTSYGSPAATRRQNSPAGSSRRAVSNRSRFLPTWHPRTPLRNITTIARAIERRRAQVRETEGQEIGTPAPEGQRLLDSSVTGSGAQLEHNSTLISPIPTVGIKHYAPHKLPNLFLDIATNNNNQNTEDSEFLTPQKKLLNSIDTVEKVVKEELQRLKRTPTAKRAEREKRVRTLMSMR